MKTTQENIRQLREKNKLSQDDMAEKLGMSKNGYGKIERGQSDLSLTRLEQIASIFEIDVAELINTSDKEMAFIIGENHGVMQNNYNYDNSEIEKLNLIIQHKEEMINKLNEQIADLRALNSALQK